MVLVEIPLTLIHDPGQTRNPTNRLRLIKPAELWLRERDIPHSIVASDRHLDFKEPNKSGKRLHNYRRWRREFHMEFDNTADAMLFKLTWL